MCDNEPAEMASVHTHDVRIAKHAALTSPNTQAATYLTFRKGKHRVKREITSVFIKLEYLTRH